MKPQNHKIFFLEEFFGSRVYNTKNQEEYFLDKGPTAIIKGMLSGGRDANEESNKLNDDLIKKGLLTSDITHIENKKRDDLSSPLKISLNITKKCNLKCKHCLSDAGSTDQGELTTKELFRLIDQMKNAGTFFITIGGGEPLLRNDIFSIIKYARENFIAVSLVTNGLLINEEIAKKLNTLNLDTITISLDGLERNHDLIRGRGNFRKTVNKIKILRKYCKTAKLAVRVTVNSRNINECNKIIKLAEKLSLDLIRLTPVLPLGRAKENQSLLIKQEEYISFLENTKNIRSKIKLILPNQKDDKKWFIDSNDFGCHCGKEACWITQTGDFYPCIFFGNNFLAGNIKKDKFLDLWAKAKSMAKFHGNPTCNNCSNYKLCRGGCRARALFEYGDINTIDPLCPLRKNLNLINQ